VVLRSKKSFPFFFRVRKRVDALKERRRQGICSVSPECRCSVRASSPRDLFSVTRVSMLWKSVVAKGSVQCHPSVDALEERRRQGICSVSPECRCSERASSPRDLFSVARVSMLWKSIVAKGSVQCHPSVDALKERRRQGICFVSPECRCSERASSPRALVSVT